MRIYLDVDHPDDLHEALSMAYNTYFEYGSYLSADDCIKWQDQIEKQIKEQSDNNKETKITL